MSRSILVIAPHADDETFGCGGLLAQAALEGAKTHVVVVGMGGIAPRGQEAPVGFQERRRELSEALHVLGVPRCDVLYPNGEMRLDTIAQLELVSRLDEILDNGYTEVYFPYASHNHDHQVVQRACAAALRPGAHDGIELIAMYEYTYSGWVPFESAGGRLYCDITNVIAYKRRAIAAYESQLKPPPDPLSVRGMELVSAKRGMECGVEYAELFHIVQMVKRSQ